MMETMMTEPLTLRADRPDLDDTAEGALVALARGGDGPAVRALIKRHNQRLFRVARAVMRDDAEAEDVVQASYVRAFTHLSDFRGDAQFSTWLTRIALNEALGRVRARKPTTGLEQIDLESNSAQIIQFPALQAQADPESEMSRQEVRAFLEQAVDKLPPAFRAVFVLRDVEGLSIEETADALDLKPETVRTRLHRARRLMRTAIEEQLSGAFSALFPFDGERCVHMADRVLADLAANGAVSTDETRAS
jgi:RNA polymerase sigma-70 factor (ECF subfamily)